MLRLENVGKKRTGPYELHDMPIRVIRAARLGVSRYLLGFCAWPSGIANATGVSPAVLPLEGRITATAAVQITVPRHLWRLP